MEEQIRRQAGERHPVETPGKVGKADAENEGNGEERAICEIRKKQDGGN